MKPYLLVHFMRKILVLNGWGLPESKNRRGVVEKEHIYVPKWMDPGKVVSLEHWDITNKAPTYTTFHSYDL